MKIFAVFLILATFALIESSIISVPLSLLFVLSWALVAPLGSMYVVAFVAGLLVDSFAGRPFGATAIFLVIAAFITYRYQRKLRVNSSWYVLLFSAVSVLVYQLMFLRLFMPVLLLVSVVLAVPIMWMVSLLAQWIHAREQMRLRFS